MLKVVTDTNTLISAFISNGNEYQILKLAKLKKVRLILSYEILWEFEEVIKRSKFGFSKEQIERAIEQVKSISDIMEPNIKLEVIKEDPDDNKVIECALEGKADYIVSGDTHLLDLKQYNGIKILTSTELLQMLKEPKED